MIKKPFLCKFHPNSYHFVTMGAHSGRPSTLHLWKIDGRKNRRSSTFKLPSEIVSAEFYGTNNQMIMATGRKGALLGIDLETGKSSRLYKDPSEANIFKSIAVSNSGEKIAASGSGKIVFLGKNAEFLFDILLNQPIGSSCFSSDETKFYVGSNRYIYLFDLKTKLCMKRWTDDAGLQITALTVSPNGKYLACAAESGYVNVYSAEEAQDLKTQNPTLLTCLSNTVVAVSRVMFNHDSQMLIVLPRTQAKTISLVHVPTWKVFKSIHPLGLKGRCIDVSKNSNFLAVGQHNGSVLLYQLDYYL